MVEPELRDNLKSILGKATKLDRIINGLNITGTIGPRNVFPKSDKLSRAIRRATAIGQDLERVQENSPSLYLASERVRDLAKTLILASDLTKLLDSAYFNPSTRSIRLF